MKDTYFLFSVILEAASGAPGWKPQTGLSEEMNGRRVSQFLVNENSWVLCEDAFSPIKVT